MSAQDGGPAYPVMWEYAEGETGMSLRDWFAGQALAGMLASGGADAWQKDAENAYTAADAMLAARAKP